MNILTDRLPEHVEIEGRYYPINTDFRAGVEFELLVEKGEENVFKLLAPFFSEGLPDCDLAEVFKAAFSFYLCGAKIPEKKEGQKKEKQAYSFEVDSQTIFADFWRFYGIDLSVEGLHWWAFRALLMGLPDDSGYKQRVYYRTCDLSGLPKKEQARINRIRNLIAIEQEGRRKMTLEERNAQMLEYAAKRSRESVKGVK